MAHLWQWLGDTGGPRLRPDVQPRWDRTSWLELVVEPETIRWRADADLSDPDLFGPVSWSERLWEVTQRSSTGDILWTQRSGPSPYASDTRSR